MSNAKQQSMIKEQIVKAGYADSR